MTRQTVIQTSIQKAAGRLQTSENRIMLEIFETVRWDRIAKKLIEWLTDHHYTFKRKDIDALTNHLCANYNYDKVWTENVYQAIRAMSDRGSLSWTFVNRNPDTARAKRARAERDNIQSERNRFL